jgi:hypothetical protein
MKIWVGVTDKSWYEHLTRLAPEEVNFWQPSGSRTFRVLLPGEPFLFKLHRKLSAAYDLTPSTPVSIEHRDLSMACGDAGRIANAANIQTQRARFLLDEREAHAIVDTMERQVRATWYATARSAGVSERDCKRIAGAFAYRRLRPSSRPAMSRTSPSVAWQALNPFACPKRYVLARPSAYPALAAPRPHRVALARHA